MTTKIAVSLPSEQVAAARRAVAEGRASSVSGYIADALARREREDGLLQLLDDLDRALGPPSSEDVVWAEKALGIR